MRALKGDKSDKGGSIYEKLVLIRHQLRAVSAN